MTEAVNKTRKRVLGMSVPIVATVDLRDIGEDSWPASLREFVDQPTQKKALVEFRQLQPGPVKIKISGSVSGHCREEHRPAAESGGWVVGCQANGPDEEI